MKILYLTKYHLKFPPKKIFIKVKPNQQLQINNQHILSQIEPPTPLHKTSPNICY